MCVYLCICIYFKLRFVFFVFISDYYGHKIWKVRFEHKFSKEARTWGRVLLSQYFLRWGRR